MKHSIVIPLYNKAPYITQALRSVMAQTRPPAELIVVDDVSTDGSFEIAQQFLKDHQDRFPHTKTCCMRLCKNAGPAHARNVGFEKSTGDIVSFLDADDFYDSRFCERVQQTMTTHDIDFLVLGIRYVPTGETDPDMEALRDVLLPVEHDLYIINHPLKAASSPGFVMGVGCNVVARRKWMDAEKFEVTARLNENIDYWYRVLHHVCEHKGRMALLTGGYLNVSVVDGSLSRTTYNHWSQIDYPPILARYRRSQNPFDRRLMGMIGKRWFIYSLTQLRGTRQKLMFIGKHRNFLWSHGRHLIFGKR